MGGLILCPVSIFCNRALIAGNENCQYDRYNVLLMSKILMLLLSKKLWPCCAWILVCWQNIWHSKSFSPLNEPYLYSCIFKNKSNVPVEHRSPNTGKPKIDGYHVLVLNTWCNSRSWVSNYSHKWLPNFLLTKLYTTIKA